MVDDGSSDGTGELATRAGATVLRNETPQGKGAALSQGLTWAASRGFSWALTMDGDGQHAPEDIPAFFRAAEKSSAALVVGNRMAQASSMPVLRRAVNRWLSRRLSLLTGVDLPDTQCGFRLIRLDVWSQIRTRTTHFEFESELLVSFLARGAAVEFVPIQVIYKNEHSKIHPMRDSLRWLRWWRQTQKRGRFQPTLGKTKPLPAPGHAI